MVNPARVKVGTSASSGDHNRNAAQSARNTAKHTARAAASMKPDWGEVGATTVWKACQDDTIEARAACAVAAVGSPSQAVWWNSSQVASTTNPRAVPTAVRPRCRPRRRATASQMWVAPPTMISGTA